MTRTRASGARRRSATVARVLAVASMCAALGAATAGPVSAATGTLDWKPCTSPASEFECARLAVPMDRADPGGAAFSLAVARHLSTGTPEQRLGTLVFVPGGPGGSGVSEITWVWSALPLELRDRFDLVTWDPRGTGDTTPGAKPCFLTGSEGEPGSHDYRVGPIDWAAYVAESRAAMSEFEAACESRNSVIAPHLGTNDNAADLDAIRQALGEEQLTLWGVSFGTRTSTVYAMEYPTRVRAMLLDGPMDPTHGWPPAYYAPAEEQAFAWVQHYFPKAGRQLQEVLTEVERHPVQLSDTVSVDRFSVPQYVYWEVGSQFAYSAIAQRVDELHDAVFATGRVRRAAREAVEVRLGGVGSVAVAEGLGIVVLATFCLDVAERPNAQDLTSTAQALNATYGAYAAVRGINPAVQCHGFTFVPKPIPLTSPGSGPVVPVLVYGSSRDPHTPGPAIGALAGAFPNSATVTYRGTQHMTWTIVASACITRPGTDFLTSTQVPATDRTCANTYRRPGSMVD